MGNYVQNPSGHVSVIATDDTWIEGKAIQQLETTAALQGMQRVVGMPDLHPGRGYPVGAAFFSVGRLYPALVGNDIGCGMALWQSDIPAARPQLDKLEKRLGSIDEPLDQAWREDIARFGLAPTPHDQALGTIGGGNHFAELQQLDACYDEDFVRALGLDSKRLMLLVHSGSRGLGEAILREHIARHGHAGLAEESADCAAYLARHEAALRFAAANRTLIAQRMLARWKADGKPALDLNHNLVVPAQLAGVSGWLHRKGAAPADQGPVVIPGSRGDYSYLVEPITRAASLWSLAHGGGRKWMRTECRERLSARQTAAQLRRTALGSRVICDDRALLFEEAPEAYKSIATVIRALEASGLVRVLARLKPVLTYKTRGA
ncbi:MAG TPA: RNA ligase RtcB family protein [Gallionellaceae bacterium]|nr:RNA ligase RtcB family protein [Gallionellaceae bacterium]